MEGGAVGSGEVECAVGLSLAFEVLFVYCVVVAVAEEGEVG